MLPITPVCLPPLLETWIIDSPLRPHVDQCVGRLKGEGYSQGTIEAYLRSIAHFLYWIRHRRIQVSTIDERLIDRFINRHLPVCRCPSRCPRRGAAISIALERLLGTLRESGVTPPRIEAMSSHIRDELRKFDSYLIGVRGFSEMTRHGYLKFLRPFLTESFRNTRVTVQTLRPAASRAQDKGASIPTQGSTTFVSAGIVIIEG